MSSGGSAITPPVLPLWYSANFVYEHGETRLSCIGYWGEEGVNDANDPYHTSKIEVLSSSGFGQAGLTALDLVFKVSLCDGRARGAKGLCNQWILRPL